MARPVALLAAGELADEVLRLAAAAGCELERVVDAVELRSRWRAAPAVLLDEEGLAACVGQGLPRRPDVVLVSHGPPRSVLPALRLGVDPVELPGDADHLRAVLADLTEGPPASPGRVVSVVGGRGGAGASVLAAAVGQAAVSAGGSALLVDCDPLGAGLDLTLGAESEPGLRWPDVRLTGRVRASALREALPKRVGRTGTLTVLSCAREGPGPTPHAVTAVVEAGVRAGETVVCDLPRHLPDPAHAALNLSDLVVLVVPAEIRACASAKRLADDLVARGADVRAVVKLPSPTGLTDKQVTGALAVPLLAAMRPEPGLPTALDRGRFPENAKGPLATTARAVLKALESR
ncbi:septum site-determining protein Ssd [Actinosynnema sp. NPDC020468]|uniref:septum site-determining protein Ssd n=1 Tax=Actinosynnema sp. NPDC020468 TaxID=3154488 RepID=UPI0033F36293